MLEVIVEEAVLPVLLGEVEGLDLVIEELDIVIDQDVVFFDISGRGAASTEAARAATRTGRSCMFTESNKDSL